MANFTENPAIQQATFGIALPKPPDGTETRCVRTAPYIAHLLQVAGLVLEHGGSQEQAIAGLLHDSIEDVGKTSEEIQQLFGPEVARIVKALTQDASLDTRPQERNEAYQASVDGCPDAVLVSCADKLHNLMGYAAGSAKFRPAHENLYSLMVPVFQDHLGPAHPMLVELRHLLNLLRE